MIGKNLLRHRSEIQDSCSEIIITDLRPEQEKDIPVIFAPGWGASCLFYERMFLALRDSGRRVVGIDGYADLGNVPIEWPGHEARKAQALLLTMSRLNISKADLVGQSAGAFPVTLAAALRPDSFRNLILVTPAGYIGKISFLKMMFHWFTNNALDPLTRPVLAKNIGMTPAIFKNIFSDLRASYAEMRAVLNFPLDHFIPEIRQKGIRIAVLYGENDTIIPPSKLLPRVSGVDLLMPIPGPHGLLILLPHGTEKVLEAFKNL